MASAAPASAAAAPVVSEPDGAPAAVSCGSEETSAAEAAAREAQRALHSTCKGHKSTWWARLTEVRQLVTLTDDQLNSEAREAAVARYGPEDAADFFPEPPSMERLIALSVRFDDECAALEQQEAALETVIVAKQLMLADLNVAKSEGRIEDVRALGRRLNSLVSLLNDVRGEDRVVRDRITVATRRIERYRAAAPVRALSPDAAATLTRVTPNRRGYERILDFYRLTDAFQYSFGRSAGGTQHFVDLRRNVAIMQVEAGDSMVDRSNGMASDSLPPYGHGGKAECHLFSAYAVSGRNAPGRKVTRDMPHIFTAISCEDGCGESYPRQHDAEFKLLTIMCHEVLGVKGPDDVRADFTGRITLWSRKPLCQSCSAVFRMQLPRLLPMSRVRIVVDEEDGEKEDTISAAAPPAPDEGVPNGVRKAHGENGAGEDRAHVQGQHLPPSKRRRVDTKARPAAAPAETVGTLTGCG